jgi:hypothetical protein
MPVTTFVQWIATEASREDEIREQATRIRARISARAREDNLTVRSTPNSGSFAKRTGLRRHLLGASVVEGQDVDLPFVVAPRGDDKLNELLDRFSRYTKASYPETEQQCTKSSVKLCFTNTKLSYDIVPMLATDRDDRQIILQANGERRETSVQEHMAFVRERTRKSQGQAGRVQFNECIRLLKWWREFKQDQNPILPEIPSIVIDLIAGKAFDERGVEPTYAQTMASWCGWAAHVIAARQPIHFGFLPTSEFSPWQVIDPVHSQNNVVSKWTGLQVDEFAEWFSDARDLWNRALRCDFLDDDSGSLAVMVELLGTPFRHHCGD